MKLLFYTECFPDNESLYSGIFAYHRAAAMAAMGHTVEILRPSPMISRSGKLRVRRPYSTADMSLDANLRVSFANSLLTVPRLGTSTMGAKLQRFLRGRGVDLISVHFAWNALPALAAKERLDIPYVVTCHGSDIHTVPFSSARLRAQTLAGLEGADAVVFVSEFLRRRARELGYSGRSEQVIPNGVDTGIFTPGTAGHERTSVGFVGSLLPVKRAHLLPAIFDGVRRRVPDASFVVVGDGPLREQIVTECREKGLSVSFTGALHARDVATQLQRMSVLVLPSLREGFGCVVIEAHACGASVIGSANGALPETIGPGGGTVTEGPDFVERFAEAVAERYRRPLDPDTLVQRASQYSWTRVAEREASLYNGILAQARSG